MSSFNCLLNVFPPTLLIAAFLLLLHALNTMILKPIFSAALFPKVTDKLLFYIAFSASLRDFHTNTLHLNSYVF